MNIVDYVKGILFKQVKRDDLIGNLSKLNDRYTNTLIPLAKNTLSVVSSIKSTTEYMNSVVAVFGRTHKPSVNKSVIVMLKTINKDIVEIQKILPELISVVTTSFEDVIYTKSMTAKQAAVLRTTEHLEYIANFTVALIDSVVDESIVAKINSERGTLPYMKSAIRYGIADYAKLISYYAAMPNDIDTMLAKIPNIVIEPKKKGLLSSMFKTPLVANIALTSNFIGSPFLSIGMYFSELQVEYYNYIKSRKETIDLKLLQLKSLQQNGESSPALEKQIAYYEEKSRKLEDKIRGMEESVKDA